MKRLLLISVLVLIPPVLLWAAQFGRPASDIDNTGSYSATEGTDLWDELEETIADDDTSEVVSVNNASESDGTGFEVAFGDIGDPSASTGHTIRIRAQRNGGSRTVTMHYRLYEATTARSPEQTFVTTAYATDTYTLSSGEADAIADYQDLRLRVWTVITGGGPATTSAVTWIEFEVVGVGVVTKTVGDAGSACATCDYASLSACESGEEGDLVALDQIHQCALYEFSDTTAVTINGSTTNATHYFRAFTPAAERHGGLWDAVNAYRLEPTDSNVLTIQDDFVRIEGLQLRTVSPTAARVLLKVEFIAIGGETQVSHSIFDGEGSTNVQGVEPADADLTFLFWNNLIIDCDREFWGNYRESAAVSSAVYNNTSAGGYYGFRGAGTGTVLKNNIAEDNTGGSNYTVDGGTWGTGTNFNASSTGTATGGGDDITSAAITFVNQAGDDYHIDGSDSSGVIEGGTDLSGDDPAVTDDIDGDSRPQDTDYDMGMDEVVSGAAAPIPQRRTIRIGFGFVLLFGVALLWRLQGGIG